MDGVITKEDQEFLDSFRAEGTDSQQQTTEQQQADNAAAADTTTEQTTDEDVNQDQKVEGTETAEAGTVTSQAEADASTTNQQIENKAGTEAANAQVDAGSNGAGGSGDEKKVEKTEASTTTNAELETFKAQVLAPFKADGKEFKPSSLEELQQLAKMGINYTRKMQEHAVHRKFTTMLERAGLLDEDKLAFAIDVVSSKNPQAIAKLLKESNIDPLDIDTRTDPAYVAGDHKISDKEMAARSTIEDIRSREGGQEVIDMITGTWDNQSQIDVVNDPQGLEVVYQHKQSGVYDRVAAFVERQRLTNQIPATMPFVQAYIAAFNQLAHAGQLNDLVATAGSNVHNAQTQPAQVKEPVATKVAAPKSKVTNGAAASAASVSQPSRRAVNTNVDLAQMSDEAFLQAMNQSLKV